MKKIPVSILNPSAALVLCSVIAGCSHGKQPDPQQIAYENRVLQLRAAYDVLSPNDKQAVLEKRVGKGMHKDVVSLSWGLPASVERSFQDGSVFEKWTYTDYHPKALHNQGMPPYQGPGYYNPSLGVEYALRAAAVVNFRNDRVVDWQQWEGGPPAAPPASAPPQFDIEEPAEEPEPAATKKTRPERKAKPEKKPEAQKEKTAKGISGEASSDADSEWQEDNEFAPIGDEGEEFDIEVPAVEDAGLLAP